MIGRLRFSFDTENRLLIEEQQAPLRIIRSFPHGDSRLVHLHNLSGGVLGGDRLELDVSLAAHARVLLTTTGSTRIYRTRADGAHQAARFHLAPGALLEYLPDPVIPYADSIYRQQNTFQLGAGAGLLWWETVAPGREARNEVFRYQALDLDADIQTTAGLVATERMRLEPRRRTLTSPLRLGPYRYLSTFYAVRDGVTATVWRDLEQRMTDLLEPWSQAGEQLWGASTLPGGGLVVRGLACNPRRQANHLFEVWNLARQFLYHEPALRPRKVP